MLTLLAGCFGLRRRVLGRRRKYCPHQCDNSFGISGLSCAFPWNKRAMYPLRFSRASGMLEFRCISKELIADFILEIMRTCLAS